MHIETHNKHISDWSIDPLIHICWCVLPTRPVRPGVTLHKRCPSPRRSTQTRTKSSLRTDGSAPLLPPAPTDLFIQTCTPQRPFKVTACARMPRARKVGEQSSAPSQGKERKPAKLILSGLSSQLVRAAKATTHSRVSMHSSKHAPIAHQQIQTVVHLIVAERRSTDVRNRPLRKKRRHCYNQGPLALRRHG